MANSDSIEKLRHLPKAFCIRSNAFNEYVFLLPVVTTRTAAITNALKAFIETASDHVARFETSRYLGFAFKAGLRIRVFGWVESGTEICIQEP